MPLDAAVLMTPDQGRLQVHVTTDAPRPLAWRLTVTARSGGGASTVTQSGVTDGATTAPLATVQLGGPTRGVAHLIVTDGPKTVADTETPFDFQGQPQP